MKLLVIVTFMLLQGCAHSDPWTERDTVLQVAYTVTLAADAITTSRIQYHDNIQEVGPAQYVLGSQPSTASTWQYFTSVAIVNAIITRALPAKWRLYWQSAGIASQTKAVISNCRLELC